MRQNVLAHLPQSRSLQEINPSPQDCVKNVPSVCVYFIFSREMAPVHIVPSVFCVGVGNNMWKCASVVFFGPHGECSEYSRKM